MPLQDDMHLISVDDHLIEHSRVWLDRMPEKYQDSCPRVIESGAEGMYSEFGTYVPPILRPGCTKGISTPRWASTPSPASRRRSSGSTRSATTT